MAMPVGARADKYRCNDQRTRHAHHANYVGQYAVVSPFFESFLLCFGETVVAHAGPELIRSVIAIRGKKLLRAHEAKRVKVVGGHHVGAAFAAIQSQERHSCTLAARLVGQHTAVFIVGMGGHHQQAGASVELLQTLPQSCSATVK